MLSKPAKDYIDQEDVLKGRLVWRVSKIIPEKEDSIPQPRAIIDTFKQYSKDVPLQVYLELQDYRDLNQEKRALYEGLSKEAQEYLKKVQEFKRKLCN